MKKTVIALALAMLCLPVLAQDKKAPEPDYFLPIYQFSFNYTVNGARS